MGAACTKDAGVVVRTETTTAPGEFVPFSQLNDDVIICILSFVSYAPFENDTSIMTLASISRRRSKASDEEARRLLEDCNAGATKLNKKAVRKRQARLPPFQTPRHYYQAAFHGSCSSGDQSLSRVGSSKYFGTLTHVLPLVSKRFHVLCKESNGLWTESLERLLGFKNPRARSDIGSSDLWEKGMLSFIQSSGVAVGDDTTGNVRSDKPNDESVHPEYERVRRLIAKAGDCLCSHKWPQRQGAAEGLLKECVAQDIFRQVLVHHKPVRLPVFTWSCPTLIGEVFYFRLHEPRYRLLIADVMAGRSSSQRNGFPLSTPRPRFLFACQPHPLRRRVACIVEVRKCHIHRDGVADIVIVPISWVLMQDVTTRPGSGGLLDATVVRSPKRSSMPVFCSLLTRLRLGHSVRLHFLEQRYKILIAEVMAGRPDSDRNDSFVAMPRPQFIYACHSPLKTGIVACVVEIERCWIRSDGSACLTVVPCSWVLIETLTSRPNSGWLFDATVLRLMT